MSRDWEQKFKIKAMLTAETEQEAAFQLVGVVELKSW